MKKAALLLDLLAELFVLFILYWCLYQLLARSEFRGSLHWYSFLPRFQLLDW